jgi:hypothetical protein
MLRLLPDNCREQGIITNYLISRLMVRRGVAVENEPTDGSFEAGVIFLRGYRTFFFYLRSEPWLILEILILGSEPVVSSSGL